LHILQVTSVGRSAAHLKLRCAPRREKMLRLLVITAHPDDEAGGFGGSLALYHARNVETHVICLTPGQAATHRGGAENDAELAEIRRREFSDSCRILQVSRSDLLHYPDGALDRQ